MRRKVSAILAVLFLFLALGFIWWRSTVHSPGLDVTRFISFGQVLADQTVQTLSDRGQIVAFVTAPPAIRGTPLHEEWEGFQGEIKKHPGVTLAPPEVVPVDPNDLIAGAGCSRAQLKQILEQHADAGALVFFFGLPEWNMVKDRLPAHVASKVIIGDASAAPTKDAYSGYFANDVLTLVLARRARPMVDQPARPQTPREWFDKYYQVYTARDFE